MKNSESMTKSLSDYISISDRYLYISFFPAQKLLEINLMKLHNKDLYIPLPDFGYEYSPAVNMFDIFTVHIV